MTDMPAEKAGKDQICPCGFSRFEYGNTGPVEYYASRQETMQTSTRAYTLKPSHNDKHKKSEQD